VALASTEQLLETFYAYLKRKQKAPATIKRWGPELRQLPTGRPAGMAGECT
jgi:hypothetical protein